MIAFWLAVELEKVFEARAMVQINPLIQKIVLNIRKNGAIMDKYKQSRAAKRLLLKNPNSSSDSVNGPNLQERVLNEMAGLDDSDDDGTDKGLAVATGKAKEYEGIRMNERKEIETIHSQQFKHMEGLIRDRAQDQYPQVGELEDQIEDSQPEFEVQDEEVDLKIRDIKDLKALKAYMKSTVGSPFCTNVLRIALNKREGMIASVLVAFYKVQLDQKMLIRAIKAN